MPTSAAADQPHYQWARVVVGSTVSGDRCIAWFALAMPPNVDIDADGHSPDDGVDVNVAVGADQHLVHRMTSPAAVGVLPYVLRVDAQ